MSIEETRARLQRQIRQAVDESDIPFSTAQQAQVGQMIDRITDAMLLEFDAMLGAMVRTGQLAGPAGAAASASGPGATPGVSQPGSAPAQGQAPAEEVLWEGRPFLSLGERYMITTERVRIVRGLLGQDVEDIEMIRILDVDHTQGVMERVLNLGDIRLRSTDQSQPNVVLRNVTDPVAVHEVIRRAIAEARRRFPFAFRQEI